jgi:hypothetical protein
VTQLPLVGRPPRYRGFTITLRHKTSLDGWSARSRDLYLTTHNTVYRQTSMSPVGFGPTILSSGRPQAHALGYGYVGARTDTTQQSGQTQDKEVEIKNNTVYVSGYTETDTTGMLSPPTVWQFSVAADINSNVFNFYFLIWSLSKLLCCVGSGFNVAAALDRAATGNTHSSLSVSFPHSLLPCPPKHIPLRS